MVKVNLKYFFIAFTAAFFACGIAEAKSPSLDLSEVLMRYGLERYAQGAIDDSIHELKKALLVDPANCSAKMEMKKILEEIGMMWGRFAVPNNTVCLGEKIIFQVIPTHFEAPKTLRYTWHFGDGTVIPGERVVKAYKKSDTYTVTLVTDDGSGSECGVDKFQAQVKVNSPPTVEAGADLDLCFAYDEPLKANFNANASDPDGDFLNYSWDFGDGEKGEGKAVSHIYKKGGAFTATVTVSDGSNLRCSTARDSVNVTIRRSPKAVAGENIATCAGKLITFDGSKTLADDLDALTYIWDFGDGTTTAGKVVAHSFLKGGIYKVTLNVRDENNPQCSSASSGTILVSINSRPKAAMLKPEPGCIGTAVEFNAYYSDDPDGDRISYAWDFGDGTLAKDSPLLIYKKYEMGGTYVVKLTIDDNRNTECSQDSVYESIYINSPPVVDAFLDISGCAGAESLFDATKSFDPDAGELSYYWDFGDGSFVKSAKTKHTYLKGGIYDVRLTVSDAAKTVCSSSQKIFPVKVNTNPVAKFSIRKPTD